MGTDGAPIGCNDDDPVHHPTTTSERTAAAGYPLQSRSTLCIWLKGQGVAVGFREHLAIGNLAPSAPTVETTSAVEARKHKVSVDVDKHCRSCQPNTPLLNQQSGTHGRTHCRAAGALGGPRPRELQACRHLGTSAAELRPVRGCGREERALALPWIFDRAAQFELALPPSAVANRGWREMSSTDLNPPGRRQLVLRTATPHAHRHADPCECDGLRHVGGRA